jgi:hypothetical protein
MSAMLIPWNAPAAFPDPDDLAEEDDRGWESDGPGITWFDRWGDSWSALGRISGGHPVELHGPVGRCAGCGELAVRGRSWVHHLEELTDRSLSRVAVAVYACEAWSRRRANPGRKEIAFAEVSRLVARSRALPWVQAIRRWRSNEERDQDPELRLVTLPPLPPGFQVESVDRGQADGDHISLIAPIDESSVIHEITHWVVGSGHGADWVGVNLALNEALGHRAYAARLRGAVGRHLGRPATVWEVLADLHDADGPELRALPIPRPRRSRDHRSPCRPDSLAWWKDPGRAPVFAVGCAHPEGLPPLQRAASLATARLRGDETAGDGHRAPSTVAVQ